MDITFKHNEGKLELKAPFKSVFVPPTIERLNITANGTYEAPEGVDGYSPITVDVIPEGVPTDEELTISGNCRYKFYSDNWTWFLKKYKDRLVFSNINTASSMFSESPSIESLDFNIIFDDSYSSANVDNMFKACANLKNIGKIVNLKGRDMSYMFAGCQRLRYLPQFENFSVYSNYYSNFDNLFQDCRSLRSIPEEFLKKLSITSGGYSSYDLGYYGFDNCQTLDEIKGINMRRKNITDNLFSHTFDDCNRVKNIIFTKEDNGSPYTATWKNQYINLASNVGYGGYDEHIIGYNSGITLDKKVIDDTTYQALKNDPDWYTLKKEYSRYNHDSAVATINSLPDTSAYIAEKGGTNTIRFMGNAGSATDGGAINTLTEEEIAVATAKGWTVAFL